MDLEYNSHLNYTFLKEHKYECLMCHECFNVIIRNINIYTIKCPKCNSEKVREI
jgi:Zn finger protein HypA/HybF involved in hydrogenase expression